MGRVVRVGWFKRTIRGKRGGAWKPSGGTSTPAVLRSFDRRWPDGRVRLADGRGSWSGGELGVLQEDLQAPQDLSDPGERVLGLPDGLAFDADLDGVAEHEQLAAVVVVRLVEVAGGETELAGGLDRVRRVADDQRVVVGVQELAVLVEELLQDVGGVTALDGDQLRPCEAGGRERGLDEPVDERRLGGQPPALVGERADQLVLGDAHDTVAHRQEDLSDGVGVDPLGERQTPEHPVGDAAREDERVDLLRYGHGGVAERPAERGHGAGALQPVGADLERVLAEVLEGMDDVVLERLVRSHLAGDFAQELGRELVGDRQAEGLDDLCQDAAVLALTDGEEQVGVVPHGVQAVAAEVHDESLRRG